jgi:predicted nucleic acid-binding protein
VDLPAPYLLVYEIANALKYNPNFGAEDLKSAVKDILDLGMDLMLPEEDQIERISDIAFKHGVTSYDAAYIAAAEVGDMLMFTADERLLRSVRGSRVRHIRDYAVA